MGWNGSGVFNLLYDFTTDRDAGSPTNKISADKMDAMFADLAAGLEATLNRNGENAVAHDISWGTYKITNLGAATAANDAVRARMVAENTLQYGGTTAGSANAYTASMTYLSAVGTGTRILLKASFTNTGATTLNINGLGATAVKLQNGSTALTGGEIASGSFFEVVYDGTNFCLLNGAQDVVKGTSIVPDVNDGASLGTTALSFSDLFLASGGVINWNAGAVTMTQGANALAIAPASGTMTLNVAVATGNSGVSSVTSGAQTVEMRINDGGSAQIGTFTSFPLGFRTNATERIRLAAAGGDLSPTTNDTVALGTTTTMWSDLFLATGGVINWNNGNVTLTHAAGSLTVAGATAVSLGTSAAFTTGTIELGAASDTTIARSGAGDITIEGNGVYRAGGTDVAVADGGTGASTVANARVNLGLQPNIVGGRLSLTTGTPVLAANTSAQTTVYYIPLYHNFVPVYDGTNFLMLDTGGELSQLTTDTTKSPAACTTNSNYDLFVWSDSGTMRCTRGPAWSSDTARGTGAGTTELQQINGIYTNKNAITNGPAANRGTYVGSIRTNGSSQVDFQRNGSGSTTACLATIGIWNMYNRVPVTARSADTSSSYTYQSTTIRARNGNTSNARVQFISGLSLDTITGSNCMTLSPAALGTRGMVGMAMDTTTAIDFGAYCDAVTVTDWVTMNYYWNPVLGFHYISANEKTENATNLVTFFTNDGMMLINWSF